MHRLKVLWFHGATVIVGAYVTMEPCNWIDLWSDAAIYTVYNLCKTSGTFTLDCMYNKHQQGVACVYTMYISLCILVLNSKDW